MLVGAAYRTLHEGFIDLDHSREDVNWAEVELPVEMTEAPHLQYLAEPGLRSNTRGSDLKLQSNDHGH